MTTRSMLIALPGALAALALAGCAVDDMAVSRPLAPDPTPSARVTASQPQEPPDSSEREREVVFGGAGRSETRSSAIVAIYGETISDSRFSESFSDGASNISQLSFTTEGADFDPDVDHTGEWIFYASTQHRPTADIYRKSIAGATITQITSDPADDMMPEVSPDGSQIAFCSNRAGNWDIYLMPAGGGNPRIITTDLENEIHPSWSPDGRQLVYCRFNSQTGRWELWTVDVANTSVRNFIDYGFLPEWSPDPAQHKILFQRARNRGSRYHSVWTIDLIAGQGRNPTEIISASNAAIINPTWSSGGGHIAFVTVVEPEDDPAELPSASDLWIVRLDGTGRVNLTNGDFANFQPTFAADGQVVFVSDRAGHENLWTVSARWAMDGSAMTPGVANAPETE